MTDQASIRQLLDQGLTHYGLGQVQEACEVWKRVLELEPQNPRALEYMKFVEMNWAPNQARDGKPYRPDEGSDPEAARNTTGTTEAQMPAEENIAQENQPAPAEVAKQPAATSETSKHKPTAKHTQEAYSPPARPVVQAAQWGDLYDFGSQPGELKASQPPTPPAQPEPQPQPEPEPQPEPSKPGKEADLSTSTLPPYPKQPEQESIPEPNAVTVSYASVPTIVRAPEEQALTDREPPEVLKLTPKAPFAQPQSTWDNPAPIADQPHLESETMQETDSDVFEQVASEMPPDEQSGAALDLVVGSSGGSTVTEAPMTGVMGSDDVAALMKGTRDLLELDDFSGALDLLSKLAELVPDNDEIAQMRAEAQSGLISIYSSKIGDLGKIPRVLMAQDEVIWLNLDHRAGFVLSLVDGRMSFDEILSVSGLELTDGMRILVQLLQEKVIEVP